MTTLRKTIALAALTLSLALAGGCASEECEGDDCSISPTNDPASHQDEPSTCGEQCAHLEGCNVLNELECAAVCENQAFSAREMACLAKVECGDGLLHCFEIEPDRQP